MPHGWDGEAVTIRWTSSTPLPQPARIHELGEVHQHNRPLLPVDQDTTPTAMSPLRRQNPREEPGALAALAGICAGGGAESNLRPYRDPCSCPPASEAGRGVDSNPERPSCTCTASIGIELIGSIG
jgi:hypothetical protein